MDLTLANILDLVRFTLQNPREGARAVMGLGLPVGARWWALLLMAVASTLLTHVSLAMLPAEQRAMLAGVIDSPLRTAVLQAVVMVGIVLATYWIGRMRGGSGSLPDAVIVIAWLQFILLCLQGVQVAAQVLLPVLADIIGIVGLVAFLWLLTNFVAELHGFRSFWLVLVGVVASMMTLGFAAALLILVLFGGPVAGV